MVGSQTKNQAARDNIDECDEAEAGHKRMRSIIAKRVVSDSSSERQEVRSDQYSECADRRMLP